MLPLTDILSSMLGDGSTSSNFRHWRSISSVLFMSNWSDSSGNWWNNWPVAVAGPLLIEEKMLTLDIWIMLAATLLFLPVLLGCRFGRGASLLFLVLYGGYIPIQSRGDGGAFTC